MKTIDLRSDTVTRPTPEMRAAMMDAPVGDDVFEGDPTVKALEAKVAALFEKEAALFVASGTMGNQISLYTHEHHRGDELICDDEAHIDWYEVGAAAALSGLQLRPIAAPGGIPDPERIAAAIRPPNIHHPVTSIIAVENTHNRAGGVVVPLEIMRLIAALGLENGIKTHLDGARIWNAAAATGVPLSEWGRGFDSISVCFSKGLGAPVGSAVIGTKDFITRARRTRKLFGGGMRQVGILAAACIWAIDHQLPRMADDHRRATTLATSIADIPGIALVPDPPPTNIVVMDIAKTGLTPDQALGQLAKRGALLTPFGPTRIRAVTHRDVDDTDIETAIGAIREVFVKQK